jgi:hypothetical protein
MRKKVDINIDLFTYINMVLSYGRVVVLSYYKFLAHLRLPKSKERITQGSPFVQNGPTRAQPPTYRGSQRWPRPGSDRGA